MRMKKFALAALACIFAASAAVAAPLDVFKGQKGEVDIAGGTAHIPPRTSPSCRRRRSA